MKKTWIFFKLRLAQLKYDKTALFFCYAFPILLLMAIGYPMQMRGAPKITLHYIDEVKNQNSKELLTYLSQHPFVELEEYTDTKIDAHKAIEINSVKHFLRIHFLDKKNSDSEKAPLQYQLNRNNIDDNIIENIALEGILNKFFNKNSIVLTEKVIAGGQFTTYIATLLPGLIGMTLLIIGLNGFGSVLIEEEHRGLFKNIKAIDASPVSFLSGLFLSRMLVSYSVAVALFLIGVFVFHINTNVNYILLGLIITLGCIAFLGLGLVISVLSPSVAAFNGIVNFVQMPFIVLGGVFVAISSFPEWLQLLSKAIPLTHMNIAMQKLMFEAVGFHNINEISVEISILITWCIITLFISHLKFRW